MFCIRKIRRLRIWGVFLILVVLLGVIVIHNELSRLDKQSAIGINSENIYVANGLRDDQASFDYASFIARSFKVLGEVEPNEIKSRIREAFTLPVDVVENKVKMVASAVMETVENFYGIVIKEIQSSDQEERYASWRIKAKRKIYLGVIACGERLTQALTMLKSAALFSQQDHLHIIAFSDKYSIASLGLELLQLRLSLNAAGWDLTFELHPEWYPPGKGLAYKRMFLPCATQRLFFPSLLPHIDSLIYLDTDTIVLSNLSSFWDHFALMNGSMAAAAPNNEPNALGLYMNRTIPHWGKHGINSGVMLMNLTRMRSFDIENLTEATRILYRRELHADQGIYNVIFHAYPESLHELSCSYNFNWVHCGGEMNPFPCYINGEFVCFCYALERTGVHIIHGNTGTFGKNYLHFLEAIYEAFLMFNIAKDSPLELIKNLKEDYISKPQNICHILTAEMLYSNAEKYLTDLQSH